MNKTKILFSITLICLLGLTNIFAQTQNQPPQAEPSYDVVLHILTASNNPADKSSVPQSLSNVIKKLKTVYSYSNYSLNSTYLERTSGNIEIQDIFGAPNQKDENPAIFSNWSLYFSNNQGKDSIQVQSFKFGQRVPLKTSSPVPVYEQIGITLQRFSVPENIPTVIASLSNSKSDDLIFLILTVKSTEQ